MAVDTRNRRIAMIGLGSPVPRVLPNPDGSFNNENDRYMLLFLYPIFVTIPPAPPTGPSEPVRRRGHSRGGWLWPWEIQRRRIELEDEEFLLFIDND